MATSTRREFAGMLGAGLLLPARIEPELALHNGNFITMDAAQPRAQAAAIAGERLLAVGSNDEILALASARTRRVDLGGKTVVPGFIDAHSHPASAGLSHLREVDCDLRSISAIQQALRERAAKTPAGQWVLGFKYDDTKTAEGRKLTRQDLDAVSTTHPIFITHRGGHTAYVNSRALELAGVRDDTPDPPGGQFDHDERRRLTGGLREQATGPFRRLIPSSASREDRRAAVALISQMMARTGITSVHDTGGGPDDLRAYQDALESGDLHVRVYCCIRYGALGRMIAAGVRTGLGNEWVRVGAVKLVCDGSISERTARLSQAYIGRPNDYGILVTEEGALYAAAREAHQAGWQIGTHANGDVAIDQTLRVYERLQRETPRRDPRFRVEHCTVVNDSLIQRMRNLGVIPTPFSTYVYYHGEKMREYGAARLDSMFALRSFLDAGIRPTQASDYPPGPFEPMMALQSEVTRTDSKGTPWGLRQRISVEEAIRVGTLHGAYASFEEHLKGSLAAGKLADLVVLGRDPLRTPPAELISIPIERTMAGGRWVFES